MQIMYNILSTHLNQLFYNSFPYYIFKNACINTWMSVIVIKLLIFTLQIWLMFVFSQKTILNKHDLIWFDFDLNGCVCWQYRPAAVIVRELRGQNCPQRGQKVWRLYLTGNFALIPKINVLHTVPGKFLK